jgi:hypothetical protein
MVMSNSSRRYPKIDLFHLLSFENKKISCIASTNRRYDVLFLFEMIGVSSFLVIGFSFLSSCVISLS